MENESTTKPLGIRLPDDLKQWLKHQAVDNRRSLNAEILIRLEASKAIQESGERVKKKPLMGLDDILTGARQVEATLGLLADLYADLLAAREDAESRQVGRALALIHAEAERVTRSIEAISDAPARPGVPPRPEAVRHPYLTV